jgi:hypothetical protein
MSLSRKRLQRRIAAFSRRTGKAAEIVIMGGLPDAQGRDTISGTRYPIETRVVARGANWLIRGNLPPLPREEDQPNADTGEGAA